MNLMHIIRDLYIQFENLTYNIIVIILEIEKKNQSYMVEMISKNNTKTKKKIRKKSHKSIESLGELIKSLDHFYKSRMEAKELDMTLITMVVKRNSSHIRQSAKKTR